MYFVSKSNTIKFNAKNRDYVHMYHVHIGTSLSPWFLEPRGEGKRVPGVYGMYFVSKFNDIKFNAKDKDCKRQRLQRV